MSLAQTEKGFVSVHGKVMAAIEKSLGDPSFGDDRSSELVVKAENGAELTCNFGGPMNYQGWLQRGDEVRISGMLHQGRVVEAQSLYSPALNRWSFPLSLQMTGTVAQFRQTTASSGQQAWSFILLRRDGRQLATELGPCRTLRGALHDGETVRLIASFRQGRLRASAVYSLTQARWFQAHPRFWRQTLLDFIAGSASGAALFGIVPALLVALLNRLGLPVVALLVAVLALLGTLAALVKCRSEVEAALSSGHGGDLVRQFAWFIAGTISLFGLFGRVCRDVHAFDPSQFRGPAGMASLLEPWLLFAFDNLSEIVFFDVPGIYDLHLSSIVAVGQISRALVLGFRLAIDFLLIVTFISFVRFYRTKS